MSGTDEGGNSAPVTDRVGQVATDALVLDHLWLADTLARRFAGRGLELEDLAQVARLALVRAAHRYDQAVGESFPAYATVCISGEIKRYFRDSGWLVRPPRRLQELSAVRRRAESDLSLRLGRHPTPDELSAAMGIGEQELRRVDAVGGCFRGVSLDVPATQASVLNRRADPEEDPVSVIDERASLAAALAGLTERELGVIRLRFVHDMTQSQIGAAVGLSQIQVSRILRATFARLRGTMAASLRTS